MLVFLCLGVCFSLGFSLGLCLQLLGTFLCHTLCIGLHLGLKQFLGTTGPRTLAESLLDILSEDHLTVVIMCSTSSSIIFAVVSE